MERSAIILSGGPSSRLGQDKGMLQLANKPLIEHVLDAIRHLVDERIVVVSSRAQADRYARIVDSEVNVQTDMDSRQTPLGGALSGLEAAQGEYSLLLPCDTPFVSKDILSLLLDLCVNKNAAIPRWPNGNIEPLQAAYCTEPTLEAARKAVKEDKRNMLAMVNKLQGVRYISTLVLKQLDPQLETFFNINTPLDLKRAENTLRLGYSRPKPR